MAELADQELSGRQPIKVEQDEGDKFQDFGYYKDEKGYMHYGVIPKKEQPINATIKYTNDPFGVETSDTRLHEGMSAGRIYWAY